LKERSKWKNQRSGKKTRAVCFGLAGKIMHGWSNVMVALEVKHGPHMVNNFSTKKLCELVEMLSETHQHFAQKLK
jgi:hypothetical protein